MAIYEHSDVYRAALDSDRKALAVFGFALLASIAIEKGKITLVTTFSNRTQSDFKLEWVNSHYFIIDVVDATGTAVSINALFPAPTPSPPPLTVIAGQDHTVVFTIDTSVAPYASHLDLGPDHGPYSFRFSVNSKNFIAKAAVTIPVAA
jgi:hypothetical protein